MIRLMARQCILSMFNRWSITPGRFLILAFSVNMSKHLLAQLK